MAHFPLFERFLTPLFAGEPLDESLSRRLSVSVDSPLERESFVVCSNEKNFEKQGRDEGVVY